MNLRQLKSFVTVCRIGNISRASEMLHISQPALSRQIQELESEFDCALFTRQKRQIELTDEGFLFFQRAQEMLELAERTRQDVAAGGRLSGLVRIGCVESSAFAAFAALLAPWLEEHSKVELELYSADGDDLRRSIDEGSLDLALVLEPVEVAKYDSVQWAYADRWGVAVRESDCPPQKKTFTAQDFKNFDLILPRRPIVLNQIAQWFSIAPKEIRCRVRHNLPSNALELVRLGQGALLCVEGSFENRPVPGIRYLPFEPERVCTHRFIRRKHRVLSRASEAVWMQICSEGKILPP